MINVHAFGRAGTTLSLTALCLSLSATSLLAQSVKIGSKEVQVHGSFQQGFIFTDKNNFLTMDTTSGSGEMTDGAVNLSSTLTPKLRVGAQLYARNIGQLGNGSPQIDWAFADYKFNNSFGVRGGKIKTVLGLFTDTQDTEFLYTWALLPQGTYPLDLRSVTIAHIGADVYGMKKLGKAGSLAYTGYVGKIQDDTRGGYRYGVEDSGMAFKTGISSKGGGFDARWTTPVPGLMTGYSYNQSSAKLVLFYALYQLDLTIDASPERRHALYADYQMSRLRLSGELRREGSLAKITPVGILADAETHSEMWFATASYRVSEKLEVGSYHSRFIYDRNLNASLADNHIHDTAITGRVDLNQYWHVKVEGHFMDGNGSPVLARGFYLRDNTTGFSGKTRMLVLRTGVSF
jgi:hypothetical protein